jgi:hypothetical protein
MSRAFVLSVLCATLSYSTSRKLADRRTYPIVGIVHDAYITSEFRLLRQASDRMTNSDFSRMCGHADALAIVAFAVDYLSLGSFELG